MGQGNPAAQAIKVSEDQFFADLGRERASFLEAQRVNKALFDENQAFLQVIHSGQNEIARLRKLLTDRDVPENEINGTAPDGPGAALSLAVVPNREQRRAAARRKPKAPPPPPTDRD